jgi:predicted XRE-type DNA-binding protein
MKALDRQLGRTEDDVKDASGDALGDLRRTAREMELNAICVTAMIQVLESRRSLPQDEWLELVGLVRSRIDALTRMQRVAA